MKYVDFLSGTLVKAFAKFSPRFVYWRTSQFRYLLWDFYRR